MKRLAAGLCLAALMGFGFAQAVQPAESAPSNRAVLRDIKKLRETQRQQGFKLDAIRAAIGTPYTAGTRGDLRALLQEVREVKATTHEICREIKPGYTC